MVSTEGIRELVEPVLASVGLELWDVEITRDVVRILVERPPDAPDVPEAPDAPEARSPGLVGSDEPTGRGRGVDLEALSDASGALSPVLDTHPEAVPAGRYQLEVSSPGIERTLRTPEQFRRYIGSALTVKTSVAVAGARRHRGRLVDVGAAGIDLESEDEPGRRVQLRFDQVDRARTMMVWGPTAGRPASGRSVTGRRLPAKKRAGHPGADGPTSGPHTSKDPAS